MLEFAASEKRILITQDVSTIPDFAFDRVNNGKAMCGVFIWRRKAAIAAVLEDLVLLIEASQAHEWKDQVIYLPFD